MTTILLLLAPLGVDLAGEWEVQSMGGDRAVTIEQRGKKLVAHRVLWPEFEGERYKLEHLYRGRIKNGKINGQLLVKEDELPDFEVLRDFVGSISSDNQIMIDGLPMRRTGKIKSTIPTKTKAKPAQEDARPSEPPAVAQKPPPPPPPPPAAGGSEPPPSDDPGVNLFANIMGTPGMGNLFTVSARIDIPDAAADLAEEGDALFDAKKYSEALAKYEESSKAGGGSHVQLLHRMGRCHSKLGNNKEAKALLRRALKLDPNNKEIRKDYKAAKRKR